LHRLGIVNFINTAPLLIPFSRMGKLDGWQITEDNPANLNRMLEAGDIDLDHLKWVVLMVLFNMPGQEAAFAWMEDMVFNEMPVDLH